MILKIVDNIPLGRFDVFEIYVNEEKYYLKRKSAIEIDIFDEEITVYVKTFNKKSKKYVFLADNKDKIILELTHDEVGLTNYTLFTILPLVIFFVLQEKLEFLISNRNYGIFILVIYMLYGCLVNIFYLGKIFAFNEI